MRPPAASTTRPQARGASYLPSTGTRRRAAARASRSTTKKKVSRRCPGCHSADCVCQWRAVTSLCALALADVMRVDPYQTYTHTTEPGVALAGAWKPPALSLPAGYGWRSQACLHSLLQSEKRPQRPRSFSACCTSPIQLRRSLRITRTVSFGLFFLSRNGLMRSSSGCPS